VINDEFIADFNVHLPVSIYNGECKGKVLVYCHNKNVDYLCINLFMDMIIAFCDLLLLVLSF